MQRQRAEWTRSMRLTLLHTVEYDAMSETEAVAFHLRRLDVATSGCTAVVQSKRTVADVTQSADDAREERMRARRIRRGEAPETPATAVLRCDC